MQVKIFSILISAIFIGGLISLSQANEAQTEAPYNDGENAAMDEEMEIQKAKEALRSMEGFKSDSNSKTSKPLKKKTYSTAEAFLAGPDWEFDGFVSGGQDSQIKSMFVLNDLLYLNIGRQQNIESGDRLSIYRRGSRVRDPQTGKFIGFEVRRAAIAEVTNKVNEETCAARIVKTFESVELGDLVRKN